MQGECNFGGLAGSWRMPTGASTLVCNGSELLSTKYHATSNMKIIWFYIFVIFLLFSLQVISRGIPWFKLWPNWEQLKSIQTMKGLLQWLNLPLFHEKQMGNTQDCLFLLGHQGILYIFFNLNKVFTYSFCFKWSIL